MFAVIKTGGKQYRVAAEDVIRIDRVKGEPGEIVQIGDVLMLGGDTPQLGAPTVAGATVAGEILEHTRGDKVIAFKKRRRKNSRRKRGHRQEFSVIRITEILTGGRQAVENGRRRGPKREPKPKAEADAAPAAEAKPAKAKGQKAGQSGRKKARQGPAAKSKKK